MAQTLKCIKDNADVVEKTIIELKNELNDLTIQFDNLRAQQLREENRKLTLAVEAAKKQLVDLETKNNVKQISVPPKQSQNLENNNVVVPQSVVLTQNIEDKSNEIKPTIEKKEKKKEVKQKLPEVESPVDIGRLDLRIAKIEDIQRHPDADTLYLLKVNCGENKPRTVCSGLVKFISMDSLKDKDVLLLCNLKPVKMRGIISEAMVMCASSPEAVEVLMPPVNCKPGDLVHCEGYTRNPDAVLNPKKKIFETVAPDLATNELLQACYKGTPIVVSGKGNILAPTLKKCQIK